MAAFLNNCGFVATAGGTSDFTYSTTLSGGYMSPSLAGVTNGQTYKYHAYSADRSQWEIGEGAYNTGTGVLARTTVLYNSSGTGTATGQSGAGSKINFSAAPNIVIVAIKQDLLAFDEANSFSTTQKVQAYANLGLDSTAASFATPSNPTGTNSATAKMMGLGSSCTLTPVYSTRVDVSFDFEVTAGSVMNGNVRIRYGTGSAPANGGAATGTAVGAERSITVPVASGAVGGSLRAIITGLSKGTAYWFDLTLWTGSGSTVSLRSIDFVAREF